MFLSHVIGLFTHPREEWADIKGEGCSVGKCYCSHVLLLAAIPAVSSYIGTTQFGWTIGSRDAIKLTTDSALILSSLTYITILVGIFSMGALIKWMGKTYNADKPLQVCIALAAYSATPIFVICLSLLYPQLWVNLVLGLPATAYSVYLMYLGVPIMMDISEERGFLFSSAIVGVGMVMLVGVLATSVVLWSLGFGPAFTD
ncbi:MAG: Yip1 family protein [Gammaproteobacteria bacterium]|nr:MAG: Yip1 family protein [Gammaproteobacteria bacterium]